MVTQTIVALYLMRLVSRIKKLTLMQMEILNITTYRILKLMLLAEICKNY
jgi:hypothetical protein